MQRYQTLSDHELLRLLRLNNEQAFSELYSRYWSYAYIVARKRLNDIGEVEDIVQEIFLNLWRKRNTVKIQTSVAQYFSGAIKYEIINRLAKKAREITARNASIREVAFVEEPTYHVYLEDTTRTLNEAIAALPERCAQVFRLKYQQYCSQKQIAAQLKISEKTVEAHLSKARKILRRALYMIWIVALIIFLK